MGILEIEQSINFYYDDYRFFFKPKALLSAINELTTKKIISKICIRTVIFAIFISFLYSILYRLEWLGWKVALNYIRFGVLILYNWPYFFIVLLFCSEIKIRRKVEIAAYLSTMYFPINILILFCFYIPYSFFEQDWLFFTGLILFCLSQCILFLLFPIMLFKIRKYIIVIITSLTVVFGCNYFFLIAINSLSTNPYVNVLDPILLEFLTYINPIFEENKAFLDIAKDRNIIILNFAETHNIDILQQITISHSQMESIHTRVTLIQDKLIFKKNIKLTRQLNALIDSFLIIEEDIKDISNLHNSISNFDFNKFISEYFYIYNEFSYFIATNPDLNDKLGSDFKENNKRIQDIIDQLIIFHFLAKENAYPENSSLIKTGGYINIFMSTS